MFISFLSQAAPFVYIIWLILLVARLILNHHIYYHIGKEEFQGSAVEMERRHVDNVIAFFTFWWSRDDMEHEDPELIRLMRISNVIHIVFIIHSVIAAAVWVALYGRH